ncbi:MAG TPA: ABC transporter permease [Desulfosporosinus sp.]|nr:ABC transporter permease [Desulfosporosinus sp.]
MEWIMKFIKKSALIFLILALWEILPSLKIIRPSLLPPFSDVLITWFQLIFLGKHELIPDILISLQRALLGFGFALLIGVPLGLLIGYFKSFSDVFSPLVHICRQIPALALFPVFILFFGIEETSKVTIVFWVSVWDILLNTISGVQHTDLLLIKAARSMGADTERILASVVLPGAVPALMTGLRLGAGSAIKALVAAEMIGAKAGLGFQVINSQYNFQISKMYVSILSIALIGIILNFILEIIEKKLTFWKPTINEE